MNFGDKQAAFAALAVRVDADLAVVSASQDATQAGAVHAETRAEGSKDTRATEAAYLARGLAQRAETLLDARAKLATFSPGEFDPRSPIAVGALVGVEDDAGERTHYLLAPVGGGTKLEIQATAVTVLTPNAPLARTLLGRLAGDEIEIPGPRGSRSARIASVA